MAEAPTGGYATVLLSSIGMSSSDTVYGHRAASRRSVFVDESRFAASPSGHQSIPGLDACVELHSDTLALAENAAVSVPQRSIALPLQTDPVFSPYAFSPVLSYGVRIRTTGYFPSPAGR